METEDQGKEKLCSIHPRTGGEIVETLTYGVAFIVVIICATIVYIKFMNLK